MNSCTYFNRTEWAIMATVLVQHEYFVFAEDNPVAPIHPCQALLNFLLKHQYRWWNKFRIFENSEELTEVNGSALSSRKPDRLPTSTLSGFPIEARNLPKKFKVSHRIKEPSINTLQSLTLWWNKRDSLVEQAHELELITFEILAAERLRLMAFDNRLIIVCFANIVNMRKINLIAWLQ